MYFLSWQSMLQKEYKIIIENIIGEICLVMAIDFCNQVDSISIYGRNQEVSIITVRDITLMDSQGKYLDKRQAKPLIQIIVNFQDVILRTFLRLAL